MQIGARCSWGGDEKRGEMDKTNLDIQENTIAHQPVGQQREQLPENVPSRD